MAFLQIQSDPVPTAQWLLAKSKSVLGVTRLNLPIVSVNRHVLMPIQAYCLVKKVGRFPQYVE